MIIKKIFFVPVTIAMVIFSLIGCDKDDDDAVLTQVPEVIADYVAAHFPDNQILKTTMETSNNINSYEVKLAGKISLDFDHDFSIVDIESPTKLPDSVIPEKIREYTTKNYPDNFIRGWELEGVNQQVELNNGLDLEFTADGEFIRIDN